MKKNHKKWVYILVFLCVIGFILTLFEFLALHDIHNEYVSSQILEKLQIKLSDILPDWTSTKGEWDIVRISYLFRFVFFVVCIILLYRLYQGLKRETSR